jgi:predicted nucleic-acid-binding protein
MMIALDTNILARFYVDDPGDPEAAEQRPIVYEVIAKSPSLFVPLTVIMELEWVLRAFYRFDTRQVTMVMEHLLGLANVNVEETVRISQALVLALTLVHGCPPPADRCSDLPGYHVLSMSGSTRPRTPGSTRAARQCAARIVACRRVKPVGTPDKKFSGLNTFKVGITQP